MQEFVARMTAGIWEITPRVGGSMERCGDRPGRWRGTVTVSGEVARAMMERAGSPLLLRIDTGLCLTIMATRWAPVGSNAFVQFSGDERPLACSVETPADPEAA
jgi:hypothetical protein